MYELSNKYNRKFNLYTFDFKQSLRNKKTEPCDADYDDSEYDPENHVKEDAKRAVFL
jgi:hypothetical protein